MRRTVTSTLCEQYNKIRGLKCGEKGSLTFADYAGMGQYNPKVYVFTNSEGGQSITRSQFHDNNPHKRCTKLRAAVANAKQNQRGI